MKRRANNRKKRNAAFLREDGPAIVMCGGWMYGPKRFRGLVFE